MVKAIQIQRPGSPEVIEVVDLDVPAPGKGEIRVRHTAVGLNFIDTYHRSGLYPLQMPSGLGLEAAGVVEAVGSGVTGLSEGDRIAYGTGPIGSYAEARVMPADKVVKLPGSISDETGAAMMLKGMTAQYLIRRIYPVQAGETVLFHAIAGGVGLIACQWLKALGATVIGTAGSEDKADLAKAHGCDHVILYRKEDIAERVKEITGGKKVPVVFDGVGKDTWVPSLDSLQPRGLLVSYGNASGPVRDVDLGILSAKGSLFVTRPTLMHYTATPDEMRATAQDVIDVVASGKVKIDINQRYALSDARQAHEDLEARKTTGQTILIP
ncbi:quinone oxidoreductase family protein [Futiania mangrovi]|uniref:Quinone oxidoreductase n=1 Tax=Futiania mangrovi TaxID=2959716 RepID=A0A9J6PBD3_9PROT|nr:quinone oxidoreductase [Futiania mangrovii]MCP1336501.1 quinone oxidoreductase [Futiania mangrovii]